MTELKTIKNLRWDGIYIRDDEVVIKYYDLKQLAIKCAKHFDKKMDEADKGEIDQMGFLYWKGRFDEVMERNNLTEEDLKEKVE